MKVHKSICEYLYITEADTYLAVFHRSAGQPLSVASRGVAI